MKPERKMAQTVKGIIEYRLEGEGPVIVVLNGGHCSRDTRLSHEKLTEHGFAVLTPSASRLFDWTRQCDREGSLRR